MTTPETLALIDQTRETLCESKRYINHDEAEFKRLSGLVEDGLVDLTDAGSMSDRDADWILETLARAVCAHRVYPEAFPGAVALVCWELGKLRGRVEKGA